LTWTVSNLDGTARILFPRKLQLTEPNVSCQTAEAGPPAYTGLEKPPSNRSMKPWRQCKQRGYAATIRWSLDIDGATVPYGDQIAWASIAILTGFPATAAPIDRSADGLPIGVQIIGGYLEDRTTIAFAGLLETAFGGFGPPPLLGSRA